MPKTDEDEGMDRAEVAVEGPLDLRETLRPLHGWFAEDGWWMTARTHSGPATLRITRNSDAVVGEAWGDGADEILGRIPRIVGAYDDPAAFTTHHTLVAKLHRSRLGWRFGATGQVFDALIRAICGQKVTGTEASRALRGLRRRFSEPAPGPKSGLRLPPDPAKMARAPYHEFHSLHLEKKRADVIREVSRHADEIDALATDSPAVAARRLSAFRGIAGWSTAKTLEMSHGDPDQVAAGDYHLKHIVVHHLTGADRGTDEEMLELLEPFRPHRGRVVRLLHTLGHEPAFGPRLAPRNITRM